MDASAGTFWKIFLRLFVPALIQSLFFNLISIIEVLMMGQLGDVPVAAVSIAGQFLFLLNLTIFGSTGGSAVYMAQYWGARDVASLRKTMGMNLLIGAVCALIMSSAVLLFPRQLVAIYTQDPEVAEAAVRILRVVGWGYAFGAISACMYSGLRSIGNTRLPMAVSVTFLTLITVINYLFIFGKLGLPQLGVQGVVVGRVTGTVLECLVLLYILKRKRSPILASLREYLSFGGAFFRSHFVQIFYVLLNELFWALGMNTIHAIFSRLGTSNYAAFNIGLSLTGLAFSLSMGSTTAVGIMIGNAIGAGRPEEAQQYGKRVILFNLCGMLVMGVVFILARDWIVTLYQVEAGTRAAVSSILLVAGLTFWLRGQDAVIVIGILRSGGDILVSALLDVGSILLAAVPAITITGLVLQLPLPYVFLSLMLENVVKISGGLIRFFSRRWIHNLTVPVPEILEPALTQP